VCHFPGAAVMLRMTEVPDEWRSARLGVGDNDLLMGCGSRLECGRNEAVVACKAGVGERAAELTLGAARFSCQDGRKGLMSAG
jgi:hypothetical protein